MKEKSLASQSGQSTKGGSLSSSRSLASVWQRIRPLRRRKNRVGLNNQVSPLSDSPAEQTDQNITMYLRTILFQLFCAERGLNGGLAPHAGSREAKCAHFESTNGYRPFVCQPMSEPNPSPQGTEAIPTWKRISDLVILACTVWVWLPLMLIVLCAVKVSSSGPTIYRQRRVGYQGRPFMIYKFRTMLVNAETRTHEEYLQRLIVSDAPMTKLDAVDKRLIAGGRFLRAVGLDELPQIFNVIQGNMSLVGPRPCTEVEFGRYRPEHRERTHALPGITGYWQINGKNKTTFNEMIAMDIFYVRNLSLWLDLAIIGRTIPSIIRQRRENSALHAERGKTAFVVPRSVSLTLETPFLQK